MKKEDLPSGMGLKREKGDWDIFSKHGLKGAVVLEWDPHFKGSTFMVLRLKSGAVISLQMGVSISGGERLDEHDAEAPVEGCGCYTCQYAEPKKKVTG